MDGVLSFSKTVLKTIAYAAVGVIIILQFPDFCVAQSDEIGIVTSNKLNVRSQPGIESPSLALISKGTKVKILEHHNQWLKILYEDRVGYIRNLKRYVTILFEDSENKTAKEDNNGDIEGVKKEERNIKKSSKGSTGSIDISWN